MTMKDLSQKIQEMAEIEFPANLHAKIMTGVLFLKFRRPFIASALLICIGFIVPGIHIINRVADIDGLEIIKTMISGFTLDASFLSDFIKTVFSVFPLSSTVVFVINFSLSVFVIYLFFALRKLAFKRVESS